MALAPGLAGTLLNWLAWEAGGKVPSTGELALAASQRAHQWGILIF